MPTLQCTNEDCQHTWFVASRMAVGADCEECGDPAVEVSDDDLLEDTPVPATTPLARVVHARARALEVLADHRITVPWVDVHAIATAEGFDVQAKPMTDLSGRLIGKVIEVNSGESPVRQRFTIAHELGHHALNTAHGFQTGASQRAIEREANVFAGELLVPGPFLHAQTESDATILRRVFKVSRPALQLAAQHHNVRLTGDI